MSFSFLPLPAGGVPVPDLVFQQMTLPALERDDGLWLRATDLARALGYPREDNVSRLYRRHADEFTASMARLVQLPKGLGFGGQNDHPNPSPLNVCNPLKSSHNAILAFQMTETTELEPHFGVPIPEGIEGRVATQNCVATPDELATELERQNGVPIPRSGNPTPLTRVFSFHVFS